MSAEEHEKADAVLRAKIRQEVTGILNAATYALVEEYGVQLQTLPLTDRVAAAKRLQFFGQVLTGLKKRWGAVLGEAADE